MKHAVKATSMGRRFAVVGDDKQAGKVWGIDELELQILVLSDVLKDPHWHLLENFNPGWPMSLMVAKGILGLPEWLRVKKKGLDLSTPPILFPLIKSKCWSDDGVHVCTKPGHSCLRKVIDISGMR